MEGVVHEASTIKRLHFCKTDDSHRSPCTHPYRTPFLVSWRSFIPLVLCNSRRVVHSFRHRDTSFPNLPKTSRAKAWLENLTWSFQPNCFICMGLGCIDWGTSVLSQRTTHIRAKYFRSGQWLDNNRTFCYRCTCHARPLPVSPQLHAVLRWLGFYHGNDFIHFQQGFHESIQCRRTPRQNHAQHQENSAGNFYHL